MENSDQIKSTKQLVLVFCFDKNYAQFAAVSTWFSCQNISQPVKVYWIYSADAQEIVNQLRTHLTTRHVTVHPVNIADNRFASWKEADHISRGAYLKLLIPEIIPESRVIYIDCDALILRDVSMLYEMDMKHCVLAGVEDLAGSKTSNMPRPPNEPYLNTGVMLLDVEAMRKMDFLDRARRIYAEDAEWVTWADQCVINKALEGRKKVISNEWNFQIFPQQWRSRHFNHAIASPKVRIAHFLGRVKPWQPQCNPAIAQFWWQIAGKLGLTGLTRNSEMNLSQAIELAAFLDFDENFRRASEIKGSVINQLLRRPLS